MKKNKKIVVLSTLIITVIVALSATSVFASKKNIVINGEDTGFNTLMRDDVQTVSLNFLLREMGVSYADDGDTIRYVIGNEEYVLTSGEDMYKLNDESLRYPDLFRAYRSDDELYLPISFIERVIPVDVSVNDDNVLILIKPVISTRIESKRMPLDYEIIKAEDSSLPKGTEVIARPGRDGEVKVYYEVTYSDDTIIAEKETERITTLNPTNELVLVGTAEYTLKEEKVTISLPYDTETAKDNEMLRGEKVVKTRGKDGEQIITYDVSYSLDSGNELSRTEKGRETTVKPVNEVVIIGTKVIVTHEDKVVEESLPFKTIETENPEMLRGTEEITTKGVIGLKTTTYRITFENGKEVKKEVLSETTSEPVNELISIGTKVVTTYKDEALVEAIPYETEIIEDPELIKGTEIIDVQGINGVRETLLKHMYENDELVSTETVSITVTKEPVTEVKRVGTLVVKTGTASKDFLSLVNEARAEAGLNPLTWSSELERAANIRSYEINVLFSHTRPDGTSCFTVSSALSGENIAMGYSSPAATFNAWMGSDGHRANILRENFRTMAVSRYYDGSAYYWAQEFGY